ncbi:hypothetical protein BV25DRAFT_1915146 [Artomyces pyxidatus]|uniref:Uncharacterized protein n=1 Tax=Artomyces pyxidatus TaxID=48021 RepID=A0ACB8T6A5_9AGAM|nr:hypothetical protein BV25DRAFT_1915146 [Artomyces pyxidatus]
MDPHFHLPFHRPPVPIDTPPAHDWEVGCSTSRFAMSSERCSPRTPPQVAALPYDPLGVLQPDHAAASRNAFIQSLELPVFNALKEASRGVLADNTWTADHPAVRAFLAHPHPVRSNTENDKIFALAALYTAYLPAHPAHEFFWNGEDKKNTAELVERVVRAKPSPIMTYPHSWVGVREMLWKLTGLQRDYAKSHARELGLDPPAAARRMSLRKRKAGAGALREQSMSELSVEVAEPPRKRARKTKADELPPTAATLVTNTRPATPSPLAAPSPLPSVGEPAEAEASVPARAKSTRNRTQTQKAAQSAAERDRSPSSGSSGSSTAVSSTSKTRARSSSSASSTVTTVGKEKEKGKEVVVEVDMEDDEPVRTTRARTRAAVKEVAAPTPEVEKDDDEPSVAEEPKGKEPTKKRARATTSRARARRSRR